jgi:DNA-binding NtrC family response regulator
VLEEGVTEALGTRTALPVNVRIMSATNLDLKELIAQGKFRDDLYFLINVLDLDMPPLRERRADLPLLMAHFLRRFFPGRVPPAIAPRAWAALMEYGFPGNVREFAHTIERAVALSHGSEIDLEHLPSDIVGSAASAAAQTEAGFRPLGMAANAFERRHILSALELASSVREHAAELLGISPESLREKLELHGITDEPDPASS